MVVRFWTRSVSLWSRSSPKPLTDEVVQAAELVITMGCGDACPIYPGRRYMEWPVAASIGQLPPEDVATSGTIGASPSSRMRRGIPTI
jgi:hypothetical protein